MRKLIFIMTVIAAVAACASKQEQKVMARYVPERADDFVFENNLIAGRIYGKALEGNPTSVGIDVWVKLPGALVADDWYAHAVSEPDYYHHDHGGKDCYKVGTSLGGGGSAPLIENRFMTPPTNYRSYEILEQTPDKVTFVLHYPEWTADGETFSLDKKITVIADSYFGKVEDSYTFSGEWGDSLYVSAGIFRHDDENIEAEYNGEDRCALWEHASDQSIEPEDGMLGLAIYMPDADCVTISHGGNHNVCDKMVKSGEPLTYYFASCWSKGDIKTSEEWFKLVEGFTGF